MKNTEHNTSIFILMLVFMGLTLLFGILYAIASRQSSSQNNQICVPKVGTYFFPLVDNNFSIAVFPLTNMQGSKQLANQINQRFNPEMYQGGVK
jgi:hypothetical protein